MIKGRSSGNVTADSPRKSSTTWRLLSPRRTRFDRCDVEFDYSRQYLKWHDNSDTHATAVGKAEYKALVPFIGQNRAIRILDFGCGMGFAMTGLKNAGYGNLVGIDADKSQVDFARARGLDVRLVPAAETLEKLDQEREAFDLVICLDVLEHIPSDEVIKVLTALRATLSKGGRFICRVPNCNSIVAMRYRYIDWTHLISFSEPSLDFILYHAGFKDIRISEQPDPVPKRALPLLLWLARRVLRLARRIVFASEVGLGEALGLPMSPNIVATATKE